MQASNVKKKFGNSVKIWRNQLGISQEELAERADLHRTYVSDVERGARNLSLLSIEKLAEALQVPIASFFNSPELENECHGIIKRRSFLKKFVDVLLVEDNADDAAQTVQAFKKARFTNQIRVLPDGEAALDYVFCRGDFARRSLEKRQQIILLDLHLPRMSGQEVLRRMKADKQTRHLPVVVLTVSHLSRDIEECLRLGADGYIVKPVSFQTFCQATPPLNMDWALLKPLEPKSRKVLVSTSAD